VVYLKDYITLMKMEIFPFFIPKLAYCVKSSSFYVKMCPNLPVAFL